MMKRKTRFSRYKDTRDKGKKRFSRYKDTRDDEENDEIQQIQRYQR